MVHLNVIAQIVVLLGTICHVVAGLRTEICEFIINTAALLVKLTMVTSLVPERETMEGYSTDQDFLLKSLPTSLYTALSKFDIGTHRPNWQVQSSVVRRNPPHSGGLPGFGPDFSTNQVHWTPVDSSGLVDSLESTRVQRIPLDSSRTYI